jgi:hypothetical protein
MHPCGALRVRPTTARDEKRMREMFARLSARTIYYRFHAPYSQLPGWAGERLTKVERHGGGSLIATTAAEVMVAHAMCTYHTYRRRVGEKLRLASS